MKNNKIAFIVPVEEYDALKNKLKTKWISGPVLLKIPFLAEQHTGNCKVVNDTTIELENGRKIKFPFEPTNDELEDIEQVLLALLVESEQQVSPEVILALDALLKRRGYTGKVVDVQGIELGPLEENAIAYSIEYALELY